MTANKHTPFLSNEQVQVLNEKHGWFKYGDAQSDVSRAFANDAVAAYERVRAAAPELLEALTKLTSFVVTDVVESCNGNKCREPWCAGCFGEEVAEQTVREAREALDAARAAIAKAGGAA